METKDDEAWTPPPGWRAAYEQQATQGLLLKAGKYAESRARMIGRVTRKIDPLHARELVQDALVDTLLGVVQWDPARVSLLDHVQGVVQSRTRHQLIRAARSPVQSIDDEPIAADETSSDGRPVEREASLAVEREHRAGADDAATCAQATQVITALSAMLGERDHDARALLGAYAVGKTSRPEVLALTGMSSGTYHNQRRRLVRLAKKLPSPHGGPRDL